MKYETKIESFKTKKGDSKFRATFPAGAYRPNPAVAVFNSEIEAEDWLMKKTSEEDADRAKKEFFDSPEETAKREAKSAKNAAKRDRRRKREDEATKRYNERMLNDPAFAKRETEYDELIEAHGGILYLQQRGYDISTLKVENGKLKGYNHHKRYITEVK